MATKAHEREKLERLCRYIARPAVSTQRLSLTRNGQIRYQLKTPYTDGTTQVIFEPLDFMYRMYGMPRAQEAQERPSPGWSPSTAGMQEVEQRRSSCRGAQGQSHPLSRCIRLKRLLLVRPTASIGRWWYRRPCGDQQDTRSPGCNNAPGRRAPLATMPCPTIGGPDRSILNHRSSIHWLYFMRRQGIARPAERNQSQKYTQRRNFHW